MEHLSFQMVQQRLANGSKDLQAGITAVSDGITVLNTSLNDGADKVSKTL